MAKTIIFPISCFLGSIIKKENFKFIAFSNDNRKREAEEKYIIPTDNNHMV
jgi:hypothetical protein